MKRFSSLKYVVVSLALLLQLQVCSAQTTPQISADRQVRQFLQSYVGAPNEDTRTTQYSVAFVDLKDDGVKEVIVYLSSPDWCGTGGCTMLILAPEGGSYKVITKTTVTILPIRVLATKSKGWHDISVIARISGGMPLYEAILPYDGETYPSSPSVPPARRTHTELPGRVVMPATAKARPLFP